MGRFFNVSIDAITGIERVVNSALDDFKRLFEVHSSK